MLINLFTINGVLGGASVWCKFLNLLIWWWLYSSTKRFMAHYFYIWNQMGAVTVNWRAEGSKVHLQFLHLIVKADYSRKTWCIIICTKHSYVLIFSLYKLSLNDSFFFHRLKSVNEITGGSWGPVRWPIFSEFIQSAAETNHRYQRIWSVSQITDWKYWWAPGSCLLSQLFTE